MVTTDLVEDDGRTTMTATVRYPSQRLRDAMLATNMARGVGESYDRLEAVLAHHGSPPLDAVPDQANERKVR